MTTQTQPAGGGPPQDLLGEIRTRVPLPRDVTPERALIAVTCMLDRHLTRGESWHLLELLPHEVQPMLAPCMLHRDEPAARFGWDELVRRVAEHLGISNEDAAGIIPGIMAALGSRLPQVAVEHVASQLPEDLRHLWAWPKQQPPRVGPHAIVEDVQSRVALPPGVSAQRAIAEVVCTLTERLPLGEARHLVQSLPESVRPSIEPCLQDRIEPPDRSIDRAVFFARVAARLKTDQVEPIIRAVFHAVQHYIPQEVVHHVHAQLPRDLQNLWARP